MESFVKNYFIADFDFLLLCFVGFCLIEEFREGVGDFLISFLALKFFPYFSSLLNFDITFFFFILAELALLFLTFYLLFALTPYLFFVLLFPTFFVFNF